MPADIQGPAAEVAIDLGDARLRGDLTVPPGARALVLFAHGSGSSRLSPRNRMVARRLERAGLATLLIDLLAPAEEGRRDLVFDIPFLARRLEGVSRWTRGHPATRRLALAYFGASTGAAAALRAAAGRPEVVAVVSRGGRPDLAAGGGPAGPAPPPPGGGGGGPPGGGGARRGGPGGGGRPDLAAEALPALRAPTLLIVGSLDREVLALNRRAAALLGGPHRVDVVEGATHLFEEPGALEAVAGLAAAWFLAHTGDAPAPAASHGGTDPCPGPS